MNRRNFFTSLIKGVGVFTILPPAETYTRIWKARHDVTTWTWTIDWEDLVPFGGEVDLKEMFRLCYAIKEKRLKIPKSDKIEIWCRPEALLYL